MSAARLREAAKMLRERASAASGDSAWHAEQTEQGAVTVYTDDDEAVYEDEHANLNDAAYIATMHPGVGLALADWLDLSARRMEEGLGLAGDYAKGPLAVSDLILGGAA